MVATWQRMPGWCKGLTAQVLGWVAGTALLALLNLHFTGLFGSLGEALSKGILAGVICRLFRLPRWWVVISLLFMPAISLAQSFMIPSWVYLWAFILSLTFFWSIIYRGAPLYLSGPKTWATVTELLPRDHAFRFIDLGSGLGGLAIDLSRQYPNGKFYGVEFAPGPWLISKIRNWLVHGKVSFFRKDYRKLNLGAYDIVFAFLSPIVMEEIADKARKEMRPGSLLLSLAFPLPGIKPDFTLETDGDEGHLLYGWRV